MKKLFVPLYIGVFCVSFTYKTPAYSPGPGSPVASIVVVPDGHSRAAAIYERMELESKGLSKESFNFSLQGYERLLRDSKISKKGIITICDLSRSSAEKRLYIIDLDREELLVHSYVAHGKNSGAEYATRFSNRPESLQSSLGFYITGNTYTGKHGLSLRLIGVDGRFNNKAYERTIVIHGASYVNEGRTRQGGYMGRSWGCPAVSQEESGRIIQMIRDGSCLFIYYPEKDYLEGSTILNG